MGRLGIEWCVDRHGDRECGACGERAVMRKTHCADDRLGVLVVGSGGAGGIAARGSRQDDDHSGPAVAGVWRPGPDGSREGKAGRLDGAGRGVASEDDLRVAIVSLDLLGFPSVLCDRVRAAVPRIAPENILIGSTHTHSAPDCYAFPDGQGGHTGDLAYMDFVCRKAAEAINKALDHLQPATIRVATGEGGGADRVQLLCTDLYDRRMTRAAGRRSGREAAS